MKLSLSILLLLVSTFSALAAPHEERLAAIQKSIAENNLRWTAGHNPIFDLNDDQFQQMLGANIPVDEPDWDRCNFDPGNLRNQLDWRDYNGECWVTPIRNQGQCGSCWDFGATACFESAVLLGTGVPDMSLDLSEQFILSCIDDAGYNSSCNGGWGYDVNEFVTDYGVPTESCLPYEANDLIPCSQACEDYEEQLYYLGDWHQITGDWVDVEAINEALLTYGPLQTVYWVYQDFNSYTGGIYQHTYGEFSGGHLVCIVGFNNSEGYWIVKNSWGGSWGENGYFRIAYDSNCGFGCYTLASQYFPPEMVSYQGCTIDDDNSGESSGDGDGVLNPAEIVELSLQLYNGTGQTLQQCSTLLTVVSGAQVLTSSLPPQTLQPGMNTLSAPFLIQVDSDVNDGDFIEFHLQVNPQNLDQVELSFAKPVGAPSLDCPSVLANDAYYPGEGNADLTLNPGEEVELWLNIRNTGGDPATDISGTLSCSDPWVTLGSPSFTVATLQENTVLMADNGIMLSIAPDCPVNHDVLFTVELHSNDSRDYQDQFILGVHGLDLLAWNRIVSNDDNGDQQADPGETVDFNVELNNIFQVDYYDVVLTLTPANPAELTVTGELHYAHSQAGDRILSDTPVSITLAPDLASGTFPVLNAHLVCAGYPERDFQILFPVGYVHVLHDGEGEMINMTFNDIFTDWHFTDYRSHTPVSSFYMGDEETHTYAPNKTEWINLFLDGADSHWVLRFSSWLQLGAGDEATVKMVYQGSGGWQELAVLPQDATWHEFLIPLTGLPEGTPGSVIRFQFTSDSEDEAEGWYLDDIVAFRDADGSLDVPANTTPRDFRISANYPNPFNPTTRIAYTLPAGAQLFWEVYDVNGQLVEQRQWYEATAGEYSFTFDGSDLASGIYFHTLRMKSPGRPLLQRTGKMLLVK